MNNYNKSDLNKNVNCVHEDKSSYIDNDNSKCKMLIHNDTRFECVDEDKCKGVNYVINLCDKIEKRRDIYEWKIKKVQFLESTGMQKVCEPNKLIIKKVTVAGPTKELDITNIIKIGNNQISNCPIDCVYIDTGKLNEYGNCDVEPGFRKIVQIEYMTDSCLQEKKKVCVIKDEVVDCGITKHSSFDKKKGKKRCQKCNKHPNHCICISVPLCKKCNQQKCTCKSPCVKCKSYKCVCRPCPKVHMNQMLYIPLYPIATPYLCRNPKHCNKHCKCVGKCNC